MGHTQTHNTTNYHTHNPKNTHTQTAFKEHTVHSLVVFVIVTSNPASV